MVFHNGYMALTESGGEAIRVVRIVVAGIAVAVHAAEIIAIVNRIRENPFYLLIV
jgi:hypothetical protein